MRIIMFFFFFQAEDGIREWSVTGVQTCALPIYHALQKRPMKRVIGPLREMGADIRARDDNFAPLEIRGAQLIPIDYNMPVASAQVKSAVLLAGLFADGVTSATGPARTRDHADPAREQFGAA